jgi:hypothetical protein
MSSSIHRLECASHLGADSSTPCITPNGTLCRVRCEVQNLSQNISILCQIFYSLHEERSSTVTYPGKGICAPWILAMGLKKEPTLQFVSPPLSELRRRIKLLDGALEKKSSHFPVLSVYHFCGSSWTIHSM